MTARRSYLIGVLILAIGSAAAQSDPATDERSFDQKMMLLWFKSVRRHVREAVKGIRTPGAGRVSLKFAVKADGSVDSVVADGPPLLVRRVTATLRQRFSRVEQSPDHQYRRFTTVLHFGQDSR